MKTPTTLTLVFLALFHMQGCSNNSGTVGTGFQAIHASADGNGWKGPLRTSPQAAMADADAYMKQHGIPEGEVVVLNILPGMKPIGDLPPNPLAQRKLAKPITLSALTGYWIMTPKSSDEKELHYYLDIQPDGKCKTDYGPQPTRPDTIRIQNESCFVAIATELDESYIFSVTQFDGDTINALIDGVEEQAVTLKRTTRPAKEPVDKKATPGTK